MDLPLQCVQTIAPEQGWGGHFHTVAVFLSTLNSTRCHCLLECGKSLLWIHEIQNISSGSSQCIWHYDIKYITFKSVQTLLSVQEKKSQSMYYKSNLLDINYFNFEEENVRGQSCIWPLITLQLC